MQTTTCLRRLCGTLSPSFGRGLGLHSGLSALLELPGRQTPCHVTVLVWCEVSILENEPHEALRLVAIDIGRPLDAYGTGLGERLALGVLGVLGGRCAVGDEHDVALAPDELLDLLALVALGDLRVGRRPPVSPAELERRARSDNPVRP